MPRIRFVRTNCWGPDPQEDAALMLLLLRTSSKRRAGQTLKAATDCARTAPMTVRRRWLLETKDEEGQRLHRKQLTLGHRPRQPRPKPKATWLEYRVPLRCRARWPVPQMRSLRRTRSRR